MATDGADEWPGVDPAWVHTCPADECDYGSPDAGAVLIHIQENHEVVDQ